MKLAKEQIDVTMTQAQVFASAWSLVGSRFDNGGELANAEQQKADLRTMLEGLSAPVPVSMPDERAACEHLSYSRALSHVIDDLESGNVAGISDAVAYFKRRLVTINKLAARASASQATAKAGGSDV
ncbi:hypothetical protein J4G52_25110 [Burkholderia cenocepacia]|uniref:hypothetical protein n=1 Tax=Burkholderia cenocepacia TaxID=95486 RepID=UPI001AA1D3F0|nr:hypothetical protein [Burkholderia cenocepacia]MBO1856822.1 hypothetical protein [Burkholderia cenocepacia]